jgi:hypothetical protein
MTEIMSGESRRNRRAISRKMENAVAEIKAQYKSAVYLGEQNSLIFNNKKPTKPLTSKVKKKIFPGGKRSRILRAYHNSLIPRQFFEDNSIQASQSLGKSLLATSELPLNAIDDNITEEMKQEWKRATNIKPPRPSPAKRLLKIGRKKRNKQNDMPVFLNEIFLNETDLHQVQNIQLQFAGETNANEESEETFQPNQNDFIPENPCYLLPVEKKLVSPLPFNLGRTSETYLTIPRPLSTNSSSAIDTNEESKTSGHPSPLMRCWEVHDDDDILKDGKIINMSTSSSSFVHSTSSTNNGEENTNIVGMIIFD